MKRVNVESPWYTTRLIFSSTKPSIDDETTDLFAARVILFYLVLRGPC